MGKVIRLTDENENALQKINEDINKAIEILLKPKESVEISDKLKKYIDSRIEIKISEARQY